MNCEVDLFFSFVDGIYVGSFYLMTLLVSKSIINVHQMLSIKSVFSSKGRYIGLACKVRDGSEKMKVWTAKMTFLVR